MLHSEASLFSVDLTTLTFVITWNVVLEMVIPEKLIMLNQKLIIDRFRHNFALYVRKHAD